MNGRLSTQSGALPQIVIVGGGARALESAVTLGDKLGKRGKAPITLIDKARPHVWKPKLPAGPMDIGAHELDLL